MRMPAENPFRLLMPRIGERSRRYFGRHAQPSRIEPVNQPRHGLTLEIQFLELQIN